MRQVVLICLSLCAILFFQCATTQPDIVPKQTEVIPEKPSIKHRDALYVADNPAKEYSWDLSAGCHISMPVIFTEAGQFEIKMGVRSGCKFYFNQYRDELSSAAHTSRYEFKVSSSVLQDTRRWYLHVVNTSETDKSVDVSLLFKTSGTTPPPRLDPDIIAENAISAAKTQLTMKNYKEALESLKKVPENANLSYRNQAKSEKEKILTGILTEIEHLCKKNSITSAKKLQPLLAGDSKKYQQADKIINPPPPPSPSTPGPGIVNIPASGKDPDVLAREMIDTADRKLNQRQYQAALAALDAVPAAAGSTLRSDADVLREGVLSEVFQSIHRMCENCDEKAKTLLPLLKKNNSLYVEARALIDSSFPCGPAGSGGIKTSSAQFYNLGQLVLRGESSYTGKLNAGDRKGFQVTLKARGDFQILTEVDLEIEGDPVRSGKLTNDGFHETEDKGQYKEWLKYSWKKASANTTVQFFVVNNRDKMIPYEVNVHLYPQ